MYVRVEKEGRERERERERWRDREERRRGVIYLIEKSEIEGKRHAFPVRRIDSNVAHRIVVFQAKRQQKQQQVHNTESKHNNSNNTNQDKGTESVTSFDID